MIERFHSLPHRVELLVREGVVVQVTGQLELGEVHEPLLSSHRRVTTTCCAAARVVTDAQHVGTCLVGFPSCVVEGSDVQQSGVRLPVSVSL